MGYEFIDVHCHLDLCKDINKIVKDCEDKGILIVTNSVDFLTIKKSLEFLKYKNVKCAAGIYPIDCLKMKSAEIEKVLDFILKNKDKIVAIGEVGIDLKEADLKSLDKQKENLGKFVKLAIKLDIPVIVHSRKAEQETIDFLESFNYKKIIMHCFSGNMKLVDIIVANGWMLSIPANVKNSQHFQMIVEKVSIENLLCETDSPFLHPDKEKNNTSVNVIESYKKISEIKKIPLEKTKKLINNNYKQIFGI